MVMVFLLAVCPGCRMHRKRYDALLPNQPQLGSVNPKDIKPTAGEKVRNVAWKTTQYALMGVALLGLGILEASSDDAEEATDSTSYVASNPMPDWAP